METPIPGEDGFAVGVTVAAGVEVAIATGVGVAVGQGAGVTVKVGVGLVVGDGEEIDPMFIKLLLTISSCP